MSPAGQAVPLSSQLGAAILTESNLGLRELLDGHRELDEATVRSELTVLCLMATWKAIERHSGVSSYSLALFEEVIEVVARMRLRHDNIEQLGETYQQRTKLYGYALTFGRDNIATSSLMAETDTWVNDWSTEPIRNIGYLFAILLGCKGDFVLSTRAVSHWAQMASSATSSLQVAGRTKSADSRDAELRVSPSPLKLKGRIRHRFIKLASGGTAADSDLLLRSLADTEIWLALIQAAQTAPGASLEGCRRGLQSLDEILYWIATDGPQDRLQSAVSDFFAKARLSAVRLAATWASHESFMVRVILELKAASGERGGLGFISFHQAICDVLGQQPSQAVLLTQGIQEVQLGHESRPSQLDESPEFFSMREELLRPVPLADDDPITIAIRAILSASERLSVDLKDSCGDALDSDIVDRCARGFVTAAHDATPTGDAAALYQAALRQWESFAAVASSRGDLIARMVRLSDAIENQPDDESEESE